ncbi:MAG TPA: hypothetical protein VIW71_06215, partial [Streptomyces sp.]
MTEAPGQQPPQDPRHARDGRREVLEGRVIPSRPQPTPPADPHGPPAGGQGQSWPPLSGTGTGEAWSITPGTPGG